MSDVTQLLDAAASGDRKATADLLPLVYDELRKLAAVRMAAESPDQTLDGTALVHKAYLRLIGDQEFDHCGHFFGAAAEAMRRILIEAARRKKRQKHGGERPRVELVVVATRTTGCSPSTRPSPDWLSKTRSRPASSNSGTSREPATTPVPPDRLPGMFKRFA